MPVLHSTTHIPLSWRERFGARINWTWVFILDDAGKGRNRLTFRCRGTAAPWWLRVLFGLVIVLSDFVMSRQMLTGIKERVAGIRDAATASDDWKGFFITDDTDEASINLTYYSSGSAGSNRE